MVPDDDGSLESESESLEGVEEEGAGSEVPPAMLRMRPRVMMSWTRRKTLVVRRGWGAVVLVVSTLGGWVSWVPGWYWRWAVVQACWRQVGVWLDLQAGE